MMIRMETYYKHGYTRLYCCRSVAVPHKHIKSVVWKQIATVHLTCVLCGAENEVTYKEDDYFKLRPSELMEDCDEGKKD